MNTARKQLRFLMFVAVATMLLSAMNVFAGPGRTTYQAKIIKPDGYPLETSSVNFKFLILNPASDCILYSETYSSVNMTSTGGLISFSLGSGVKTYPVSATTFEDVFSNITPNLSCEAGAPPSYSPLTDDIRKIVMQFHDGAGWQTLPAMNINAVPYAMYANEAQKLNGKADTDFVQVSVVPTCTASEAIRYNGTNFSCVAVGSAAVAVTSGSVTTALGYTPADGASLTTITSNISNVSSTVFSVSSTVTSLINSVAVSFATITSSQWLTSGTAISYESGYVGIGTSNPTRLLDVRALPGNAAVMGLRTNDYSLGGSGTTMTFQFGAVSGNTYASINALSGGGLVGNTLVFQSSSGNVGIGTSSNATKLVVSGGVRISMEPAACDATLAGTLRYNSGLVEFCNGTTWSAFGVAGAGITSMNGSTSGAQIFATGITGTVFNISSSNGVHTFNIPLAASGSVAAGLLSNSDYVAFTNKVSATSAAVVAALGYAPASATAVSTLTSNLATVSANTAASFAAITSSQWNTSGTSINYTAGNVGVGTSSPVSLMHISGNGSYQFHISGASDTNRRLRLGYDTANNYGAIQALNFGTIWENLILNPAGGNVGIGIVSATARLHIVSGTSTLAPLRMTAGTLLATPASGVIEYDGSSFYLTDATNTRRAIVTDTGGASGNMTLAPTGSVIVSSALSVATHLTTPTIYGSSLPSGNLTIDSTSSATKGNILLAPSGGYVGVGTANPTGSLHVALNNPGTAMSTISDAFVLQNKNVTANALTSIMFANQDGFGTGQIAALQNTGNVGSKMFFGTKSASGGAWNTSQMVLDTNGSVGIGTGTPAAPLHLRNTLVASSAGQELFRLSGDMDAAVIGSGPRINFENSSGNTLGASVRAYTFGGALTGLAFDTGYGNLTTKMVINNAGNVGIGTVTPDEKLTVSGGRFAIINSARWDHMAMGHDGADARFDAGGAENGLAFRVEGGNGDYPATSYTEVMRLMPTGRVGIGTANPGSRFHIATPASGSVNNRWVSGNSNGDLIDMTGTSGDMFLDHSVGARMTASTSTTLNRAATFKIDAPPNINAAASSTLIVSHLYALWVEAGTSLFGGNVGVGVSGTPSSYGHGGTNQFIEIQNQGTAANAQSHLFLTTGVSQITSSSIGTLTWAQPNVSSGRKEVAWISASTESASGAAPAANLQIHTRSITDASPIERMRVTASGRVGIGVSNPVTLFSNVAATANHSNVGDSGGTGENTNSLIWSTAGAGYSAAITNTSISPGANGLNIRTLGTTSNYTILSAGVGVSSTANSYDVLTVKASRQVGINQASPLGVLTVNGTMALQPATNDHIYMELYARTATPTVRSGWFGYGVAGTNLLSITNETAGHININPNGGGFVGIDNPNPTRLLHVGNSAIAAGTPVANFQNADGTCTLTPAVAGSGVACSSDERLKENFIDLGASNALEKILKFQAVSYNFKTAKDSDRHTGYRAQEVQKILPELVRTDDRGFFQVYYDGLIPWITEAIKEVYTKQNTQAREIANVKAENAEIKAENMKLKERLDRLEKRISDKK